MSTFIGATHADNASTNSLVIAADGGLANNDYMLALLKFTNSATINAPPAGWTNHGSINDSGTSGTILQLFGKLAASEGANFTFGLDSAVRVGGSIAVYRGGFNIASPIDAIGSGTYFGNDTILRSPGATAAAASASAVLAGGAHNGTSLTFTPPASPGTWAEDVDTYGDGTGRFARTFANTVLASSGATGNIDGTMSTALASKYAFLVIFNVAAAGGQANPFVGKLGRPFAGKL